MAAKHLYTNKYTLNLLTTVSQHAKSRPIFPVLNDASYKLKII
jgi:hypothetical protein